MNWRAALLAGVIVALLLPGLMMQPSTPTTTRHGPRLVIISPHNEQIRSEFGAAFSIWHQRHFGEAVDVEWNTPGGTTEIRRLLVSQFQADLLRNDGRLGGNADLLFGGGSYEFMQLRKPIEIQVDGQTRSATILVPVDLPQGQLDEFYGANSLGGRTLYDPERSWFGTALSTFGIVVNRPICAELGVPEPDSWQALADPRLLNSVTLANPGQSGSVATAFEAILLRLGWERGWQVLRRAAANSRSITGSSAKGPLDVSDGEAAAAICIDFYGRAQSQAMEEAATIAGIPALNRVAFHEVPGDSVWDPDPIGLLRGAPNPVVARRFIEYCLSREGQALWQFAPGAGQACGFPRPQQFALRRLPISRQMYRCCMDCFVDKVNPFDDDAPFPVNADFRSFIAPIFQAMAVDERAALGRAWRRIITHPAYPETDAIVVAADVADGQLHDWLLEFDAMPSLPAPLGETLSLADPANLGKLRAGWLKGGWVKDGLWPTLGEPGSELRERCAVFFRDRMNTILDGASPLAHSR